jgi:MFS family permease
MDRATRNALLYPVYLPAFLLAFSRGIIIPILPLYAKSFDISYSLIGLILAGEGIGTLLADIPAGNLLRRMGKKPVMILGVSCVTLSVLGLTWAQSVPQVVVLRLMSGLGAALWNISRHAYLTDIIPAARRGRAISVFGGIMRIGTFAGPVTGGVIAGWFDLRAPFIAYACLGVAAAIVSAIFIKRVGENESDTTPHTGGHLFRLLKSQARNLSTAGAGQLFAQGIRSGRHIIIPLYATDVIGLDVLQLGWVLSISSFVDMIMFYPAGVIMDRFGRKFAIVPCFLTQALAMSLIPLTSSFTGLLLATCLMGLGNGIGSGTMMTLGADLAPAGSVGEFLGVWRLIGDLGHSGAPLAVGNIADVLGLSTATYVIAGFGLAAGGIFMILVPETLAKTESQTG